MNSLRYFVPWAFRYMFGGTIRVIKSAHRNYCEMWADDKVFALLVTVGANAAFLLFSAIVYGFSGKTFPASETFLIFVISELLYFVMIFVGHLVNEYRKEQHEIIRSLKK